MKQGALYVVAVPIGNPDDITLRALQILKSVDCIAAEDTREFKKLALHHHIPFSRLLSYGEHNETGSAEGLLKLLDQGQSVAVVTDAGTPGISDPGYRVVNLAFKNQKKVIPIPGVSALTCALSICPLGGIEHVFAGFLPPKKRQETLKHISASFAAPIKLVVFEGPHRVVEHLEDALAALGDGEIFICRELTKPYEESFSGTIKEALAKFSKEKPLGEFVMIYKITGDQRGLVAENLDDWLKSELIKGKSARDLLKEALKVSKLKRKDLFQKILAIKDQLKDELDEGS